MPLGGPREAAAATEAVGENIPLRGVEAPLPVDVRLLLGLVRDQPVPIRGGDDRS